MKTIISSVGFQDDGGNLLANGSIILSIPTGVYKVLSGAGQVVARSFIINLDNTANLPANTKVWASDELAGTPLYRATLCRAADGGGALSSVTWKIAGTSPIDLSLLVQQ